MENVYERLLELWSRERANMEVQEIPGDFLEELSAYIGLLRRQVRLGERESPNTLLKSAEIEMITRILRSLLKIRLAKILDAAMESSSVEKLLPFEKRTWTSIQQFLTMHKAKIENGLSDPKSLLAESDDKLEIVVFLRDFPKFVGEDLRSYGPFKEGDVATIYHANVTPLVQKKIVRLVKLI